jgi:anti-anti-sigma factor
MRADKRIEVGEREGAVIATFLTDTYLGAQAVADLHAQFGAVASRPLSAAILDCSRLQYLDSGSLRLILRLHRVLRRRGRGLTVCGLHPTLREVFQITRLDRYVPVRESVEEALEGFSPRPAETPVACAFCVWPRAARCLLCGTGFCEEHGRAWARLCRRHRWVAWAAAVALVGGLLLLWALLRAPSNG